MVPDPDGKVWTVTAWYSVFEPRQARPRRWLGNLGRSTPFLAILTTCALVYSIAAFSGAVGRSEPATILLASAAIGVSFGLAVGLVLALRVTVLSAGCWVLEARADDPSSLCQWLVPGDPIRAQVRAGARVLADAIADGHVDERTRGLLRLPERSQGGR